MSVRAGATSRTVRARRAVITTCLANAIEWYDFAIYGALASVLATVLLSPHAESGALTVIFAVFSTSFLARPLGSLLIGVHADRFGRQRALAAMILLMASATAAIGLLPPWSAIGVAAPTCLVILRIVQGFSSGGEISASIPFLVESAGLRRWGWYTGWHLASVGFGIAGGLAVAAALSGVLATDDLERWGWRIPFLIAVPLGLIGLVIRRRLDETPAFLAAANVLSPTTLRKVWRGYRPAVWTGLVLAGTLAGTFNIWFVFLPAHLVAERAHGLSVALTCAVTGLVAAGVAAPLLGRLSDRIGRRPVLLAATSVLCVLPVPAYALATGGSAPALLVADVAIGVTLGGLVVTAYVAERFPVRVRASGVGMTLGVGTALVGGTAPLIGSVLAQAGLRLVIPIYIVVLGAAGLAATLLAPAAVPLEVLRTEGHRGYP
jgi:MHS family proline/betaine transporter-like MFS transporter